MLFTNPDSGSLAESLGDYESLPPRPTSAQAEWPQRQDYEMKVAASSKRIRAQVPPDYVQKDLQKISTPDPQIYNVFTNTYSKVNQNIGIPPRNPLYFTDGKVSSQHPSVHGDYVKQPRTRV